MVLNIKKTHLLISLLLIISLSSGCLETPQATPAAIDENALLAYGWSQLSIEENSLEQTITDSTSIILNSTTVKYHNDRLTADINEQVLDFKESNNLPVSIDIPESLSAQIITYRLSLPSGAKLPTELVSKIMESKIDEMEANNDVTNVEETSTKKLILDDGTETIVKIFSAAGNSTDSGMRMLGFVTAFENGDTSTIVIGVVPNGEYNIDAGIVNGTLFSIDGNSELDEMLELVSTIE
ncbi:hypothetical protein [Methanolobus sp. ZRKC5]|uniref:hypothetical protein n=1 Tax=unclassified Methanolobus TaxID=2629569 RepID=UPI00313AD723